MGNSNYSPDEASRSFVAFESGRNLDTILAKLFKMQQEGKILKGSSKEYSPKQLAEFVLQAGKAIKKYLGRLDVHLTDADYEAMPEINNITRQDNLRQAVIDSLKKSLMNAEPAVSVRGQEMAVSLIETGESPKG